MGETVADRRENRAIMSIPIDYQFAIKALVLLVAVYFDVSSKSKDA